MRDVDIMFGIFLASVFVFFLLTFVYDDYATYRRLNKCADELIVNSDMSYDCKYENLSWLCTDCLRFYEGSIFFKRQYGSVIEKIGRFMTESGYLN